MKSIIATVVVEVQLPCWAAGVFVVPVPGMQSRMITELFEIIAIQTDKEPGQYALRIVETLIKEK